jgi:hypothetical protein
MDAVLCQNTIDAKTGVPWRREQSYRVGVIDDHDRCEDRMGRRRAAGSVETSMTGSNRARAGARQEPPRAPRDSMLRGGSSSSTINSSALIAALDDAVSAVNWSSRKLLDSGSGPIANNVGKLR